MMEDLIKAYEDRGVKFWVENGQLKFKAPSGTLNAEDKVMVNACVQAKQIKVTMGWELVSLKKLR